MKQKREWKNGKNRLDFTDIPFFELYRIAYEHAEKLDLHRPFIGEGVTQLIDRINPKYVTFEFRQKDKEEYQKYMIDQGKALGYI